MIIRDLILSIFGGKRQKTTVDNIEQLLHSMSNMVVVYDKNLVIQDVINPQSDLLSIFGEESLVGYTLQDLVIKYPGFAEAADKIYQHIKHTKESGDVGDFTYEIAVGGKVFYSKAKSVIFSENRVACFAYDVSASVIAEKEVVRLNDFLQLIIGNLPVAVFVKDVKNDYRSIFYNNKLLEFYDDQTGMIDGYLLSSLVDEKLEASYHREDVAVFNSNEQMTFDRTLYDEKGVPCKFGIVTKRKLISKTGEVYILSSLVDTTKIKKNEIELANARNEIVIALEAGAMSAWMYDVEKRMFSSLYGDSISGKAMSFNDMCEKLHPESVSIFNNFMQEILSGDVKTRRAVLRVKDNNSSYGWYETYASGMCMDKIGSVTQIVGTQKNITYEVEKQRELKESKMKLELAFDAAGIVMWDYDVEENLLYSPSDVSVLKMKRFSLEDYITTCVFPEYRLLFREVMASLIYDEIDQEEKNIRLKSIDGKIEWAQFTAKVVSRNKTGKAIKIIGTRKFITESVEAANRLKIANFKTDLILKSSGIVQWDFDCNTYIFTSPDPRSFMHKGFSLEQYRSQVHDDDKASFDRAIEMMTNGEKDRINIQLRFYIGNEIKWFDVDGVAFEWDENGRPLKVTGFRRDITEMKTMTNELIILRDKAEEASRLKSAFLANMSHEIRTPLNAIVGFSNLVSQSDNREEKEEFCKIIETNNDLLLQLINDILDLSKIEAGQLEFISSEMDVSDLFYSLEHIFKYRVKEGVNLIVEIPSKQCLIFSERNRLTQVVVNFLSNACKFTSSGSITMGYELIDNGLRFFVKDTGKGIAKHNLPNVFDRFAKFDNFVQGTGLGLSICKTIVGKLNGKIGVDSEEGRGSLFWFTIPCEILNEAEIEGRV